MSPFVLALLAAVCIGALGFALVPSLSGSSRAAKRKKALQGDVRLARQAVQVDRQRENRRKTVQDALKSQQELLAKQRKRPSLQKLIFQAGMKTKKGAFIRNSVIVGVVVCIVCFFLEVPLLYAAVFGFAAGYVLPRWYLKRRRKKYQAAFLDELPNAVEAIVRGVKSGMPLNDSIRVVANEAKEPIRSEFQRILDQQSFGKTMAEAVTVLYDRVPLSEVNFFIVVINVQQQAGGNLSEALTNLSRVLRNRKKMKAKVKAMSAEAKASAGIIGSLPFAVAGLVSLVSPAYLQPLFSGIGLIWLGVAAIMMSMGVFVMSRMVQFDY